MSELPIIFFRRLHFALTIAWMVLIPVAIATGWVYSIVFVSAISLYANVAAHFAAWQGARAEHVAGDD